MAAQVLAACGNDCAACPRYTAAPYEKTPDELRRTAELWYAIGYRDRIVSNEEVACSGCSTENWCRYRVASCCAEKSIPNCGRCPDFPCATLSDCFAVTASFARRCRAVCTADELARLTRAFFEKEQNLRKEQLHEKR